MEKPINEVEVGRLRSFWEARGHDRERGLKEGMPGSLFNTEKLSSTQHGIGHRAGS